MIRAIVSWLTTWHELNWSNPLVISGGAVSGLLALWAGGSD